MAFCTWMMATLVGALGMRQRGHAESQSGKSNKILRQAENS